MDLNQENDKKNSLKSLRLRYLLTFGYLCLSLVTFGYLSWPYWALLGLTRPYWALLGLTLHLSN